MGSVARMEDVKMHCRRCGRELAPAPADVAPLPWWDTARVHAQGWIGEQPHNAVGLECLTVDESNFLLPVPRASRPRGHRFRRDRPTGPRVAANSVR